MGTAVVDAIRVEPNAVVTDFNKNNEHKIRKSVKVSAPWSAKFIV
jgi:hypothetical protein